MNTTRADQRQRDQPDADAREQEQRSAACWQSCPLNSTGDQCAHVPHATTNDQRDP